MQVHVQLVLMAMLLICSLTTQEIALRFVEKPEIMETSSVTIKQVQINQMGMAAIQIAK